MTQPTQKDVRTRMLQALSRFNIKQVDVARQAGIHHSTLSLWLQGKVKGHHIKIEDTLNQWLQSLYSGKPRYTTLNKTIDKQFVLIPASIKLMRKRLQESQDQEVLIPIHFDFQHDGKRYKQQFCWNIKDPYYTPDEFAHLIILQNPSLAHFETQIKDTIQKSINCHRPYKSQQQTTCIKTLEVDIKIDNICLKDRFDWDINDESNSPQDFAFLLVEQMNLNNQFMVKIAHQIREQIQYYRKSQTLSMRNQQSYLDIKKSTRNLINLSGNDPQKQTAEIICPTNFIRKINEDWQPKIQILDAGQIRKFQKLEQRQNRYARRTR